MVDNQLNTLHENISDVGRVIFFVGAGVSVTAGFPLWKDATDRALRLASDRGLSSNADAYAREKWGKALYYDVFEILRQELTEPAYYSIASEVFGSKSVASEVHKMLVRISSRGIITTNFDECLTSACVLERGSPPIRDIGYAMASDGFFVINPHGTNLDPRTMVLSTSDWQKVELGSNLKDLLALAVNHYQLIFLGYGFGDPDFKSIWAKILRERVFRVPAIYCCHKGSLDSGHIEEFKEKNVQVLEFPDDGSFAFIPKILTSLAEHTRTVTSETAPPPSSVVAQELERYVLICLQFSPSQGGRLALVAKAITLELFATAPQDRITFGELLLHVQQVLGQKSDTVQEAVNVALQELEKGSFARIEGEIIVIDRKNSDALAAKARKLEESEEKWIFQVLSEQAVKLNSGLDIGDEDHIRELFDSVLLESGRGVAELLLFNRPPTDESSKTDELVERYCLEHDLDLKKELYSKVIKRMLFEPSEVEEELLFSKLQSYFIANAYVLNPTSERLVAEYARDHWVYFDSSIILPALAIGHPSNSVYKRLLHRTRALGMRPMVITDMVNEVWANIRSAVSAFKEFSRTSIRLVDILEGYVAMHGSGNGNVFMEGFLNTLRSDASASPIAYMTAVLGCASSQVKTEQVAAAIFDSFGIESDCLKSEEVEASRLEPLIASIEHLRKQGGRFKTRLLCEHEAKQFFLIHLRREQNPALRSKIWFVTTDRFVVELQRLEREKFPLPIAYTPRNWFQYLDLVDFENRGSRHFSRLQPKMRFGVVSGDLGIDAIRVILKERRDLLQKGVVSVKELAEAAVQEYHVRQAIAEYDRYAGSYVQDGALREEARAQVRDAVQKAIDQFVTVRVKELDKLKKTNEELQEEKKRLEKKLAKERYITRTLRLQTSKKKKKK